MIEKERIDELKKLRKKYYTLRDLICGWPAIITCVKKKKRTITTTLFLSHVKSVKLFHGTAVFIESSGPIYISRQFEDAGPKVQLSKLKKEEVKLDLKGIDLDNIVLTEGFKTDIREFVLKKLEEVMNSEGDGFEEEGETDIF